MIVEQTRFGFRRAFVPNDGESARRLCAERNKYGRITVMNLEPLVLPGFEASRGTTGIISLEPDYETVLTRFRKTVRNEISRTYRDPGFSVKISPDLTHEGYALLQDFFRARNMKPFPRSTYRGCTEFLASIDGKPASGILLYPSSPVPVVATIFSKRRVTEDFEDYKRVGFASKRVMAEACKWAIVQGMKAIDLSSLDPDSTTVPGITEYKMSFAPEIVPRYIYEYSSPVFKFLERIMIRINNLRRFLTHV